MGKLGMTRKRGFRPWRKPGRNERWRTVLFLKSAATHLTNAKLAAVTAIQTMETVGRATAVIVPTADRYEAFDSTRITNFALGRSW